MYDEYYDDPALPSRQIELLRSLRRSVVVRMERFALFQPTSPENTEIWGIPPDQYFSRCGGLMLFTIQTGMEVRACSNPWLMSVQISVEKTEDGVVVSEDPLRGDADYYHIDALDPIYSNDAMRSFVGKRIETFRVFRLVSEYAAYEDRPCEAALAVIFVDGSELVLSQGLHNNSDDFSVITHDMIDPRMRSRLIELPLDL